MHAIVGCTTSRAPKLPINPSFELDRRPAVKNNVRTKHIYHKDPRQFEEDLNVVLARLVRGGAIIDEIKYSIDASTEVNHRGGFGALVVFEEESDEPQVPPETE
jgi:hypothetical protein